MGASMFRVINEFVDVRDGSRVQPGETFDTHDAKQAARLVKAGCLEALDDDEGDNEDGTDGEQAKAGGDKPKRRQRNSQRSAEPKE